MNSIHPVFTNSDINVNILEHLTFDDRELFALANKEMQVSVTHSATKELDLFLKKITKKANTFLIQDNKEEVGEHLKQMIKITLDSSKKVTSIPKLSNYIISIQTILHDHFNDYQFFNQKVVFEWMFLREQSHLFKKLFSEISDPFYSFSKTNKFYMNDTHHRDILIDEQLGTFKILLMKGMLEKAAFFAKRTSHLLNNIFPYEEMINIVRSHREISTVSKDLIVSCRNLDLDNDSKKTISFSGMTLQIILYHQAQKQNYKVVQELSKHLKENSLLYCYSEQFVLEAAGLLNDENEQEKFIDSLPNAFFSTINYSKLIEENPEFAYTVLKKVRKFKLSLIPCYDCLGQPVDWNQRFSKNAIEQFDIKSLLKEISRPQEVANSEADKDLINSALSIAYAKKLKSEQAILYSNIVKDNMNKLKAFSALAIMFGRLNNKLQSEEYKKKIETLNLGEKEKCKVYFQNLINKFLPLIEKENAMSSIST